MNTPGALPKYIQISEFLIREIASGRLMDGARLKPEREMALDLGISVGTLRKALDVLEQKELLQRIQGSGNYINHGGDMDSVYAMFRLELHEGGGLPRGDILSVELMDKPADLPQFGTKPQATRIRRLRFLNTVAIALEEIWLDAGAGVLDVKQITDSLYHTYRAQLDLWITRAEDRVAVGPVPDWAPAGFDPRPGALCGFIERFSWAKEAQAVEFSRTWFDSEKAHYVQRLK